MRFISRLIWLPVLLFITVFIALFVVANQQIVQLVLWPASNSLSMPIWAMPIWAAVLGAGAVGLLIGGAIVWLAGLPTRVRLRMLMRKLEKTKAVLAKHQATSEKDALEKLPQLDAPTNGPH